MNNNNPEFPADLVTFTEEILNGKLHFLCSAMSVMIDYSKTFDTIDHESLIRKLVSLNFSNSSIKIILSYLTNQKQYVQVNDKQSIRLPIYTSESTRQYLGPGFIHVATSMLLNYQHALNQIQFSMQMTLIYTDQVQKQMQYQP